MKPVSQWDRAQLADLIYDAFYSGAIGGSAVALFFLIADTVAGTPLLTPSILGSSLFLGADASTVTSVRLDAVAYYSIFHLAACSLVGSLVALGVHTLEYYRWNSTRVMVSTFVLFQATFLGFAALVMPSVVERIGLAPIATANLLAATGVAGFLHFSRGWRAAPEPR